MATLEEEKEEFLKHYGVKGMKWGKRGARAAQSSQRERNAYFKKNPTMKQYFLGKGETKADRRNSRVLAGKLVVGTVLAGVAAKTATSLIPALEPFEYGVNVVASALQGGAYAVGVGTIAAEAIDGFTKD